LVLLALFILALSILFVLWEVRHEHPHSKQPNVPEIRDPKSPSP
jgi:hypothetical protein